MRFSIGLFMAGLIGVAICPSHTHAALTPVALTGSWDGSPPGTLHEVMQTMLGTTYDVNAPANRVQDSGVGVTDQTWTIYDTATTALLLEIAGYKDLNSFGIYNLDTKQTLEIFKGSNSGIKQKEVIFDGAIAKVGNKSLYVGSSFGFYLKTPDTTFYSRMGDNANGLDQMVTQQTAVDRKLKLKNVEGGPEQNIWWKAGEYLLAWEDLALPGGDKDYQDMVIKIDAIAQPEYLPVPEPSTYLFASLLLLPFLTKLCRIRRN